MKKITLFTIFILLSIILSNFVYAIDNSYAFTIKIHKQNDKINAYLDELHLAGISDLVDQESKKNSDYAYKVVGETVFRQKYYQEYVVIDNRVFMNTKFDCFNIIDEKVLEKIEKNALKNIPSGNQLIEEESIEEEPPMTKAKVVYDPTCGGTPSLVEEDETVSYVNIPYTKTIDNVKFYDKSENIVAELDLSEYADYCGDYICSYTESYLSCPIDCMEEVIPLLAEQIFRTENSEITSNKDMSAYVTKDLCLTKANSCAEVVGNEIYISATDNSQIKIDNNNNYNVHVNDIADESKLFVNEEDGVASVTNRPFKVKGDWSQISNVDGSFQKEDGTFCNYDFDSSVTAPVTIKC